MLETKLWLFYNGCRVIKWQAEPAETTNMLQSLLQSTEKENQLLLSHLLCIHIGLWSMWPWSSTSIFLLTSTMFIVLHIVHRNYEQVELNKDLGFSSRFHLPFFWFLRTCKQLQMGKSSAWMLKSRSIKRMLAACSCWSEYWALLCMHAVLSMYIFYVRSFSILAPVVLETDAFYIYLVKQDST